MNNMLIRPTTEELRDFGEPDFTIYNAGEFPANRFTKGMTSQTSVQINFKRMEMVILGTEYGKVIMPGGSFVRAQRLYFIFTAGEMKKGVFSVMVRLSGPMTLCATDSQDNLALSYARQIRSIITPCCCERRRERRKGRNTLLWSVWNWQNVSPSYCTSCTRILSS